jgi:hypothetical protein
MKATCLAIFTMLIVTFGAQRAFSQTIDSSSAQSNSRGTLQIQSLGGWGIYYIGDLSQWSYFRVGADLSFNHSTQSGSLNSYSLSTTSLSSLGSDTLSEQPDETANSYQIDLSALYIQKLAQYKSIFLYCGAGPMFTYSWGKATASFPYTETSQGTSTTYQENDASSSKTTGIGPVAILGVRSQLVDRIGISAEIGLSAIYQWNSASDLYTTTFSGPPTNTGTENQSESEHLKGWNISLSTVRIGVTVAL